MAIVCILVCCVLGIIFSIHPDGSVDIGQIIFPAIVLFVALVLFLVHKNQKLFDLIFNSFGKFLAALQVLVLIVAVL